MSESEHVTDREPLDLDCDGTSACPAVEHIHGCYSDDPCPHVEEGS